MLLPPPHRSSSICLPASVVCLRLACDNVQLQGLLFVLPGPLPAERYPSFLNRIGERTPWHQIAALAKSRIPSATNHHPGIRRFHKIVNSETLPGEGDALGPRVLSVARPIPVPCIPLPVATTCAARISITLLLPI